MTKNQIIKLLSKVIERVDATSVEDWPGNIQCSITSEIRYLSISIHSGRAKISFFPTGDRIMTTFLAGTQYLETEYTVKNIISRQFCPVWRKWRVLFKKARFKERANLLMKMEAKKKIQKDAFNTMYYCEFPEDIEDILLRGEDDE